MDPLSKLKFLTTSRAICLAKNPQCHGRTKHVYIKYHYIDMVEGGKITLVYCPMMFHHIAMRVYITTTQLEMMDLLLVLLVSSQLLQLC